MYQPIKTARHQDIQIRNLRYRVHTWGDTSALPVFFLHGWADVGMSFQFLADAMSDAWYCIAPDWRGFGDSQWNPDGYWFPDYFADLDALIEYFSPGGPVRLVGHSMGGNVAWMYAGIRPGRASHAVSLDVYGMPDSDPGQAPSHYARWLDQLRETRSFALYKGIEDVAERIRKLAPRLPPDRVTFLAAHWSERDETGRYRMKFDPAHKRINPVLYRRAEARSCWQAMTARVLLVLAGESSFNERYETDGYGAELRGCITDLEETILNDTGHMMHLEQPDRLAAILEQFLTR